tara:strand:+ start:1190 stop:1639 length:450 start_codon:yes stop_codon:yes gene_type:complete
MTTNVYYRFEYGFGKELELLIKVNELLSGDLNLIKTDDKYCCVDYRFLNDERLICYIELKSRKNISGFADLMIGKTKLYNISKLDKQVILLWVDGSVFYHCVFSDEFLKYKSGYCGGSGVIYIPKSVMTIGNLESFVESLQHIQQLCIK